MYNNIKIDFKKDERVRIEVIWLRIGISGRL